MPKLTLAAAARHAFTPDSRERGGKLFRFRRVDIDAVKDGWFSASVRVASDAMRVVVGVRPARLLVDCTCDGFARESPCMHIWSVLLAIEQRTSLLPELSGALFVEPLHAKATRWNPCSQLEELNRARRAPSRATPRRQLRDAQEAISAPAPGRPGAGADNPPRGPR